MEGLTWLKFALRLNPAAQVWEHEWTEREPLILSSIRKVTRPSFFEFFQPGQCLSPASVYKADCFPVEFGAASRLTVSFPRTLGVDLSGRVVVVGCKVVDIGPGEGVFGRLSPVKPGSLAEYVIAPYEGIVVLPVSISPWLAGAAGTSSLVANQSIAPDFHAADKVFINGGSGGVESFAIQVAKALDCHVTVTCSTDKIGLCQSLGADEVIDYKKVDVMNALYQHGRVFAHVVGKTLPSSMGGEEHRWKPLILENSHADLTQIARWMEEGKPETMIDQTFALDEVPEAFKRLKKGSLTGKVLTQRQRRIDRQTV
ncbi:Reticulon-4-interacting protein 1 like [Verticillium longisporum]|nr:Reticulon-4-interacting protein 1 like [Verticillium longisporum]